MSALTQVDGLAATTVDLSGEVTTDATQTLTNKTLSGGTLANIIVVTGATFSGNATRNGAWTGGTLASVTLSGTLSSASATFVGGTLSGPTVSAGSLNGTTISGASTINNTAIGAVVPAPVTATTIVGTTISSTGAATILNGTAIPANGTVAAGYKFSSTLNFGVFFGSGAPNIAAAKGSLYLRSDGTGVGDRAYIATDSAGTWVAITTAG